MAIRIILVTGGLGFIGKHFISRCLDEGHHVINVDTVNYAADRAVMREFGQRDNYRFLEYDIAQMPYLPECDVLVNFAAESHVDESISDNQKFCVSNILGVQRLLELIRKKPKADQPMFIQISTDEVYGDIEDGRHSIADKLKPSNPYSATKAAADLLIQSWWRTYGVEYKIVRMTNNYGMHQYPEKLIPKSCHRIMRNLPALMHGDGSYIRSWLHVEDATDAIYAIMDKGAVNQIYNVCGDLELRNIEVLRKLCKLIGVPEEQGVLSIPNRVGQDVRYSVDDSATRALGWKPTRDFDEELTKIVRDFDFERFL